MSLATRCAACGTVFRVVQDQLKVSEGWVRCGRCGEVFNALEGLFDLDREAAPAWSPSQRGSDELLPAHAGERIAMAAPSAVAAADHDQVTGAGATVADSAHDTEIDTRVDSQIETRLSESAGAADDDAAMDRGPASEPVDSAHDDERAESTPEPTPSFLRQAEHAARWQRRPVRRALLLAATLLAMLLAAQAALLQRDALAARWPQAVPLLAALCAPLDCRIEPLRHLDGLVVESSGLTQLADASLYRLQVSLRNRDAWPLLTPALELTLTDNRGEVVARKVLGASDFGAATPRQVAAGGELALQAVLDTGERRVSGYSIEIFYP